MARKMTEWPSKRGPITKIMPSDGCIGDTVPLAVGKWYDFHEFGWYMGNVGSTKLRGMRDMFGKSEKEAESGPAQPARGFGKSDKDTSARGAGKASGEASAISADLKVVGNLESAGDIQVDGTVVGDINSRSLTVGEGAHVEGSITAEKVRICGKLSGQVTAASVSIAATAVMNATSPTRCSRSRKARLLDVS